MKKQSQQHTKTPVDKKSSSESDSKSSKSKSSSVNNKVSRKPHKTLSGKDRKRIAIGVFVLLLWTGVSIVISQLIVGWIMLLITGTEFFMQPVTQAVYSALSYVLAFIMIAWAPAKIKIKWKEWGEGSSSKKHHEKHPVLSRKVLGIHGLPTWTDIGLAPIGFIVSSFIAAIFLSVLSAFPWFDVSQNQSLLFDLGVSGGDKIVAFITLVVVAPIAEELIFRGWLYGNLRMKSSKIMTDNASMIVSSILTSVLFGVVHFQWNVGVTVFVLSIILCAMREITGTTYAGILTHMLKNGVAFYYLFVLHSIA